MRRRNESTPSDGAVVDPWDHAAGLGVAFHGKAALREAADTALSRGGLDRVLYLLGFRASDVEALAK